MLSAAKHLLTNGITCGKIWIIEYKRSEYKRNICSKGENIWPKEKPGRGRRQAPPQRAKASSPAPHPHHSRPYVPLPPLRGILKRIDLSKPRASIGKHG